MELLKTVSERKQFLTKLADSHHAAAKAAVSHSRESALISLKLKKHAIRMAERLDNYEKWVAEHGRICEGQHDDLLGSLTEVGDFFEQFELLPDHDEEAGLWAKIAEDGCKSKYISVALQYIKEREQKVSADLLTLHEEANAAVVKKDVKLADQKLKEQAVVDSCQAVRQMRYTLEVLALQKEQREYETHLAGLVMTVNQQNKVVSQ